ncbi:hypothetical protein HaLaN_18361, partial [Haematococcus lacustris]
SDASSRRLELPRSLKATDLYEEQAAKALKAPLANPLESSPLNFSLPAMPEKLSDIKRARRQTCLGRSHVDDPMEVPLSLTQVLHITP